MNPADLLSIPRGQLLGWAIAGCLVAIAAGAGAGAWLGYDYADAKRGTEVEAIKRQQAEDGASAARDAAAKLKAAQDRGDLLTTQLAEANATAAALKTERDDAIRKTTTGRRCLDAAAVRVLNDTGPAAAADLPQAASGPEATDAADFATDTDIGLWASNARAQYEECARRLDKLISWEEARP